MGGENEKSWTEMAAWGVFFSFTAAVVVVVYQVYVYLKHGVWVALSVIDGLLYINGPDPPRWFLYPDDWVGVHKLLENTPLAFGLALLGILCTVVVAFLCFWFEELLEREAERQRKRHRKRKDDSR